WRQFRHFGGNHFLRLPQTAVDGCEHEVLQHFHVFRIDDLRLDRDAQHFLFAIDDGRHHPTASHRLHGSLFQLSLQFGHFLLHFLHLLHHLPHVAKATHHESSPFRMPGPRISTISPSSASTTRRTTGFCSTCSRGFSALAVSACTCNVHGPPNNRPRTRST